MESFAACRVCLSSNVRMYLIGNTLLQDVYEKLVDNKLETNDRRPTIICYICYAQLLRCWKLIETALKSESILDQLLHSGIEFTENTQLTFEKPQVPYTITPVEQVNLSPIIEEVEVTTDSSIITKDHIKHEFQFEDNSIANYVDKVEETIIDQDIKPEAAIQDDYDDYIPTNNTSDSEDDLPLKTFKKDNDVNKKRKYKKVTKLNAKEVILTEEEQLQEVKGRANSANYLDSPYKCNYCYKGFVKSLSYSNHMEKHDERSGEHECSLCRLRYTCSRALRAHREQAHSRRYQCNVCPHRSHTKHQAYDHDKWHGGHTYECKLCSQRFRKRTSYLTHIRKSHPTEHVCNVCGEHFVGSHGLLMHKSKAHKRLQEENSIEPVSERFCSECNIQFVTRDAWKRHILSSLKHSIENKYNKPCPICLECITEGSISGHMKLHEKELRQRSRGERDLIRSPVKCEQCGTSFANRPRLKAHIWRMHYGLKYNKNIVCEVCGKKCTSNAGLINHQRTHTGEKPFKCKSCTKRFVDSNQLRIHTRVHTGEKPYSCDACDKRFTQKPALNRHYRVHTGAKPYICQICSKSFSQSNSMKMHVKRVHFKMPPNSKRCKNQNPTESEKTQESKENKDHVVIATSIMR